MSLSTSTMRAQGAKMFMIPLNQAVVCDEETLVCEVMETLVKNNFIRRRCYVIDEESRCVGMVGLASLTRAYHRGVNPKVTKVKDIMKKDFGTVSPDSTPEECRASLGRQRIHHLVVTSNGTPQGRMLGALSSWIVAEEQSLGAKSYPHNVLARNYQTIWQKATATDLRVIGSKL
eukprot:TRINITY_DN649_c1_g1_i1.p1 TRINITY_DN649_c1_g1~~TRINITY_DN649_c1_g1_i1.p1  ORF type:complete len:175 (+),score=35.81 TRINITY_DN649_c1_g1_i1:62-586(+)